MPYTSLAQLIDHYGERTLIGLSDRAEVPTGVVDTDVVDRALTDTDAVIDGYLKPRYQLPLSEEQPLIADLAQVIAYWKLHLYEPDPKAKKDYEDAMRMLRDISGGVVRLSAAGVEPSGAGGTGVRITDRERPMSADKMTGWI